MANVFKYLIGKPTRRAHKKGNIARGIGGESYGPTSATGYTAGVEPPVGGYVIVKDTGSNLSFHIAQDDADLINVVNLTFGGNVYSTEEAKMFLLQNTNTLLYDGLSNTSEITDGLVINLDADNPTSFINQYPTTNLSSLSAIVTWNNSGTATWNSNDTSIPRVYSNLPVLSMEKNTQGNSHFGCGNANITTSTTYTVSLYVYIPSTNSANMAGAPPYFRPFPANYTLSYLSYNGSTNWANWPRDKWIRVYTTATTPDTNVTSFYISSYLNNAGDKVYYTAPQMEVQDTVTPFTSGSRINTWYDISNGGHHCALNGGISFDYENRALVFNGTNSYGQIENHADFAVDTRTVEITFKMNSSYADFSPLVVFANDTSADQRMWLGLQNSKFQMHGWGTDDPTGTTTIEAGKWYTCVFSYNKATQKMKMYTNGNLESHTTNSQVGINGNSYNKWYLGRVPGGWNGAEYSNLTIKSFRVYDRILTDDEVASNYYGGEIVNDNLTLSFDPGNLVSYTSGSSTIDSLDNSYTGTLYNGAVYTEVNGGVIALDGVDDYISVGPVLYTGNPTQSVTWEVWVNPADGNGNIMSMSSQNPQGGWNMPPIVASGGKFRGKIWSNNPLYSDTYTQGQWYQVVLIFDYDNARQSLFVNGKLVSSQSGIGYSTSNTNNYIFLGQENPGADNTGSFGGKYGPFRIYSKALTPGEVLQNFNAHRGRFGIK